jgi:hypothetical protein
LHSGMTGESVIRRVGQTPHSEEVGHVLNVPIMRWRWQIGAAAFLVVLVGNRVIATKRCSEAAITKC